MKTSPKLKFNAPIIQKRLLNILTLVRDILSSLLDFFIFYWKQLHQFSPQSYLSLLLNNEFIILRVCHNNQITEEIKFKFHESHFENIQKKLQSYEGYPIYLLVFNSDCEFRSIDLGQIRWIERPATIKQILLEHFEEKDWVMHFRANSFQNKKKHYFIALKPSSNCNQFVQWMALQNAPIISIQHAIVPLTQHITKSAKNQVSNELNAWVCIVFKTSSDEWHITVCHNESIVSYRHGHLNEDTFFETDLIREIKTTLRYIDRLGYTKNDPISFIQCGFKKKLEIQKDCIIIDENFENKITTLSQYRMFDWIQSCFGKISISKASFLPKPLIPHIMSVRLSKSLLSIILPMLYFFLMGLIYLPIKLDKNEVEFTTLKATVDNYCENPGNFEKKILSSKIFQYYVQKEQFNVMEALYSLSKLIGPQGVVTDISWNFETNSKTGEKENILIAHLEINEKAFSHGKYKHNRNKLKSKTLEEYFEKIEKNLKMKWPVSYMKWENNPSSTSRKNLRISFKL